MQVTYYGHATFLMEIDGTKLLFDPYITPNPQAKHIDIKTIKPDYILVSHAHFDHVEDVAAIAKHSGAKLISNVEICAWFEKHGVKNSTDLNFGGNLTLPFGKLQYVKADHSSAFKDGTYGGNPGGFIITHNDSAFYYSGDTALMRDMKLFGRLNNLTAAFLCIGDHYTMGYQDAAIAADFLKVDNIIGMHFDTFPDIKIDHTAAMATFHNAGKKLKLPVVGETFTV